jgi:hypothetical protein
MWMGWFGCGAYLGGPIRALDGCMMVSEPGHQLATQHTQAQLAMVRTCDMWRAMARGVARGEVRLRSIAATLAEAPRIVASTVNRVGCSFTCDGRLLLSGQHNSTASTRPTHGSSCLRDVPSPTTTPFHA